jgi:leucyl-tRNA synthetase
VNGKLRGKLMVAANADNNAIEAAALASAPVRKMIEENGGSADPTVSTGARVIVVPNRLVNVVLPRKSA